MKLSKRKAVLLAITENIEMELFSSEESCMVTLIQEEEEEEEEESFYQRHLEHPLVPDSEEEPEPKDPTPPRQQAKPKKESPTKTEAEHCPPALGSMGFMEETVIEMEVFDPLRVSEIELLEMKSHDPSIMSPHSPNNAVRLKWKRLTPQKTGLVVKDAVCLPRGHYLTQLERLTVPRGKEWATLAAMGMTARITIDYGWSANQMESRLAVLFRGQFAKRAGQRFSFTYLQYVWSPVCAGLQGAVCPRHPCRMLDWRAGPQNFWTWCFVHPQPPRLPSASESVAHTQIRLTSSGEVSDVTITELVKQFFREQLLNGTAHTVNVTKIQRVGVATTTSPATMQRPTTTLRTAPTTAAPTTAAPTTAAPTTAAPTTAAPTTAAPTTAAPTTAAPTTVAPTTTAPTTAAPTTAAPTTAAPTTAAPTTAAPTTAAPTTAAPTTAAPTTAAPTTAAPTTAAPTTAALTTAAPTTAAPTTAAPTTAAPTTSAPTTAAPTTVAPTTAAPTTAAPTTATPTTAAPTTAAPTTAAPTTIFGFDNCSLHKRAPVTMAPTTQDLSSSESSC